MGVRLVTGSELLRDFEDAIERLEQGLRACPDPLWQASLWEVKRSDAWVWPVTGEPEPGRSDETIQVFSALWLIAYHCLFYLDFYLAPDPAAFETPDYIRGGVEEDPINEHGTAKFPDAVYPKELLLTYLAYGRQRARAILPALTDEQMNTPCPAWHPHAGKTLGQLLQVNLAHVQEHGGQISEFVRAHVAGGDAGGSTRARAVIDRLRAQGVARAQDGTQHELFPVSIGAREGDALRDLVVRERAVRTIEVGLGYGLSALHIWDGLLANGNAAASHTVMDPFQRARFGDIGLHALAEVGVADRVDFYDEGSQFVLPRLLANGQTFDLAFVDGNHRFEFVLVDLFFLGKLVRPGGVIALDDYQLPGIARAAAFFTSNLGWTVEEVVRADPLHHLAVLRTSRVPDNRAYGDFVDF